MQRRQKTASRTKPANIVALRDPAKRIAFADAVGSKVAALLEDHPAASLEQRGSLSCDHADRGAGGLREAGAL
jgi:hypothetical protein